jgi:hypothetical protein
MPIFFNYTGEPKKIITIPFDNIYSDLLNKLIDEGSLEIEYLEKRAGHSRFDMGHFSYDYEYSIKGRFTTNLASYGFDFISESESKLSKRIADYIADIIQEEEDGRRAENLPF